MPYLRIVFALLLSLALPLYGYAGLAALPCAMASDMNSSAQLTPSAAHQKHACCPAPESTGKSAKTCKAGSQCKAGSPLPALPAATPMPVTTLRILAAHYGVFSYARNVASIWRPPT
ncbi:MAG: hypothetical protein HYZ65_03345 [Burkholderiales bacterium]|nr:hypothetical protein [Burkholderiales bacterium]